MIISGTKRIVIILLLGLAHLAGQDHILQRDIGDLDADRGTRASGSHGRSRVAVANARAPSSAQTMRFFMVMVGRTLPASRRPPGRYVRFEI